MAVKPIIPDELSLKFKSLPATKQDLGVEIGRAHV